MQLRAAGKPVVVSMGDLAASGGYYIAAPADVIYAEPSTMSGSIGVFGYKVDAQKLLGTLGAQRRDLPPRRARRLPVAVPALDRGRAEAGDAADRATSTSCSSTTVAEGRALARPHPARVDELGRGHVWTGALAQAVGLVDRMGGARRGRSTRRRGWAACRSGATSFPS